MRLSGGGEHQGAGQGRKSRQEGWDAQAELLGVRKDLADAGLRSHRAAGLQPGT